MLMNLGNEKGAALILTLVLFAISSVITVFLIKLSKDAIESANMLQNKIKAEVKTKSAVEFIKYFGSVSPFSHNSMILNNMEDLKPGFFENIDLPDNISFDGKYHQFLFDGVEIKVKDGSSMINLWNTDLSVIENMLLNLGIQPTDAAIAVDSLADWKDNDDFKHLNGAERHYYSFTNNYNYLPRNSSVLQGIDELFLIRGFASLPSEVSSRLKEYLYYAMTGGQNINTMDKLMLKSVLGVRDRIADRLMEIRKERPLTYADITNVAGIIINEDFIYRVRTIPNKVLVMDVKGKSGYAVDRISTIIGFNNLMNKPYLIYKWVD